MKKKCEDFGKKVSKAKFWIEVTIVAKLVHTKPFTLKTMSFMCILISKCFIAVTAIKIITRNRCEVILDLIRSDMNLKQACHILGPDPELNY